MGWFYFFYNSYYYFGGCVEYKLGYEESKGWDGKGRRSENSYEVIKIIEERNGCGLISVVELIKFVRWLNASGGKRERVMIKIYVKGKVWRWVLSNEN